MTCFDALADEAFQPKKDDWIQQGARLRRTVRRNADLTAKRTEFLSQYAIANANRGQGEAKPHACHSPALAPTGLNTAARTVQQALAGFPRYSARLLLTFRLLTPLLTKDDDPFYLFDNPTRKDHLLGLPYLSAASLKGLSADAYQRAFPNPRTWLDLGNDDPNRTSAFRHADPHAKRLFGIADDGVKIESEKGRLHFSPVWFNQLQLLVINRTKEDTATGDKPIQFEAVAPDQIGVLEVIYFNPYGIKDSDEATVRADLARWLAAVATWWPALGLGAKRLAGYGANKIEKAELQVVDWMGMNPVPSSTAAPAQANKPSYYQDYLCDGAPLSQEVFDSRLQARLTELDNEIAHLAQEMRNGGDQQTRKRAQRKHDKTENQRKSYELDSRGQYRKVLEYWEKYGQNATIEITAPTTRLTTREENGEESWLKMAEWIAEKTHD